jgi:phage-related protein
MALKPVRWVGSSLADLRRFPAPVRYEMGYALYLAQKGDKAPPAKPLKGISPGAGVLEVVEDHRGDTYRAVYTVTFRDVVYVLHVFQKKAKRGSRTPQREMDVIRVRYQHARLDYEGRTR